MTTRFHYASQSAMLFALFMDGFEVGRLNEWMAELIQHGIGGRNTTTYAPEITLLSRVIYYTCSLASFGRTPGQAFCDFTLTGSVASEDGEKSKKELVRKLQRSDMVTIALLYSILPYLFQRKDKIYNQLAFMYHVLVSPEDGLSPPPTDNTTTNPVNPITEAEDNANTTTASPDNNETPLDTYFSKFLRALCSSVASISTNQNDRMETLYKYAADIHRMLFLYNGSYLELPLRLMQVRMISKSPARNEASMKALSWLVGFRVSLLTYYAARVLLSEIDKQQHTTPTGTAASAGDTRIDASVGASDTTSASSSSTCAKRCSLCIDALVHPAVVPCGHIFCWDCIVPYATGNRNREIGDNVGGSAVKCPICRTEFQSQKIRALFNYV